MLNQTISLSIFAILMAPGILGSFLPILPGIPYMFLVSALYVVIYRWGNINWVELAILGAICIISLMIDYGSGIFSSKVAGAAAKSTLIGFAAMIIGLIVFPPFGGLIGLFVGIFIGEYLSKDSFKFAFKSASYGLVGTIIGMAANLLLSIAFLTLFVFFAIK